MSKIENGFGTITSDPPGIDCGPTCSATFSHGTVVTLHARTTNGSNSFFANWHLGPCSPDGPSRTFHDCTVKMDANQFAGGSFKAQTHNLVFVSSQLFPSNLVGTAPYDAACNQLATAAGINNAAGNAYIAFLNDANSTVRARLGTARGFIRLDGGDFADDQATLFTTFGKIFLPIAFDENGGSVTAPFPWTCGEVDAVGTNCNNWTGSGSASVGDPLGGPVGWAGYSATNCSGTRPILCAMRTKTATLTPIPRNLKRVYLSEWYTVQPGAPSPDKHCNASKPAGMGTVKALVATTTSPAAAALNPSQNYMRVDSEVVGFGHTMIDRNNLLSGIWQTGDGLYRNAFVWTGSDSLTSPGTTASTCGNWTDPNQTAPIAGFSATANGATWWKSDHTKTCNYAFGRFYCVEQ